MKANLIYAFGIAALIGYGIYSLFAYEDEQREQAYFLIPFGILIAGVFYVSTRDRKGK